MSRTDKDLPWRLKERDVTHPRFAVVHNHHKGPCDLDKYWAQIPDDRAHRRLTRCYTKLKYWKGFCSCCHGKDPWSSYDGGMRADWIQQRQRWLKGDAERKQKVIRKD
jgi:hypothetical protein